MIRFVIYEMVYTKRRVCANKRSGLTPRQRNRTQKHESSPKTSEAGIEVKALKQRSIDKQIVSHQIGVATRQHELAIENYLPNRTYQLVFFFSLKKIQ